MTRKRRRNPSGNSREKEALNKQADHTESVIKPEEAGSHTDAETAPQPEIIPETEPENTTETETVTVPETEPEIITKTTPENEAEIITDTEAETVPEPKPVINTIKETQTLMKDKDIEKEPARDGMPEFLRSANSTIRRDGPYKDYTGNADILRHADRKEDGTRSGSRKKRRKSRRKESFIAAESISLLALAVIILVIFICAIKHVEFNTLSLAALLITSIITVAMGIFLGEAPSYVALILVALIIIAGAVTGMFSEVITGVVIFLGTLTAIKGRFD